MSVGSNIPTSHVGDASSNQVGAHVGVQAQAGPRAAHVGAANHETQLQAVHQDVADAEAVVEHPHPHED